MLKTSIYIFMQNYYFFIVFEDCIFSFFFRSMLWNIVMRGLDETEQTHSFHRLEISVIRGLPYFWKQIAILSSLSTFRLSIASLTLLVSYLLAFLNYAKQIAWVCAPFRFKCKPSLE